MRIVVGITGASGAVYGITILEYLKLRQIETHLIISRWAEQTITLETGYRPEQVAALAYRCYAADDMAAAVSSGSFVHSGMVIAPCSMKTLASIACGFSDSLIARAADVTIKEGKKLVLMPRETPLSAIHLENMLKLARIGVAIMPPVPAFYNRPAAVDDIVKQSAGRALDLLGIENDLLRRWGR
ncbi:UbiX family flavin prenyltransferase [Pelotomaculum propionicicum]|uniref:UbiX family flavin prenyltransferase n=1 Tax=Pelotomaculum propionicicum TaxID=258475 RepID=UPI003B7DD239